MDVFVHLSLATMVFTLCGLNEKVRCGQTYTKSCPTLWATFCSLESLSLNRETSSENGRFRPLEPSDHGFHSLWPILGIAPKRHLYQKLPHPMGHILFFRKFVPKPGNVVQKWTFSSYMAIFSEIDHRFHSLGPILGIAPPAHLYHKLTYPRGYLGQ